MSRHARGLFRRFGTVSLLFLCLVVLPLGAAGPSHPARAAVSAVPATVSVTPSSIVAGGQVTVAGSGFAQGESVSITLNTNPAQPGGQPLGTASADNSGSFSQGVTILAGTVSGSYLVVAKGQQSGNNGEASLQVTGAGPAVVSVTPSTVQAGGQVAISGSGFGPNESVSLLLTTNPPQLGGQPLGTATADGSGSFSFANATIPAGTPARSYLVVATGGFSGRSANTPLTVTAAQAPATVSVNPTVVQSGGQVAIAGTGFTPGETIDVLLTSNPPQLGGQLLAVTAADGSGNFSLASVTIPVSQRSGNYLVVASATVSGQRPSTPLTVTAPTAPATVSVNPTSVAAGGKVTISGTGFAPGESVGLTLKANATVIGGQQLATATAAGDGTFNVGGVTIPVTTPSATYLIVATGGASGRQAQTPLTVTAPRASLTVSPTTFSPNSTITASGSGYLANEVASVVLIASNGASSTMMGTITADGSGACGPTPLRVPYGVPAGSAQVVAAGQFSNRQASVAVQVTAVSATLSVTPSTVNPADKVLVAGTNFQPGEGVSISLVQLSGSIYLTSAQADASGSFSLTGVTIPADAPQGAASVVGTGASSHLSASAQITINANPAHLVLSSASATAGSTVGATGSGFAPGETVTMIMTRSTFTPIHVGTVVAGPNGAFTTTIAVPATLNGPYTVSAYGETSGRVAKAPLQIDGVPAGKATIGVVQPGHAEGTPYAASPGGLLAVVGSNFPPNADVTLTLSGYGVTSTLGTTRATSQGTFGPTGVTVPASTPPGSYTLGANVADKQVADTAIAVRSLAPTIKLSTTTLTPGESVTVRGIGYADGEQVVLALNGAALATTPSTILTTAGGTFSAGFTVPASINAGANTVTTTGVSSRASASVVVQGTLPAGSSYYFADGDTTGGTHTAISLLNSGGTTAAVTLTFLYTDQPARSSPVRVPAHSQLRVDLNLLAGTGRHVSTIVTSSAPIGAQCTVYYAGADNATSLPAQSPATRWYEAEGYTGGSFQTSLVIANPNTGYATVDVHFLPFNGKPPKDVRFSVRPRSNLTVDANQYMPRQSFSTIVTSDKGVVIARTIHFGVNHRGATVGHGSALASTVWQFAQGDASANHQTFLTILNPNESTAATVTATFYNSQGSPVGNRTIVVDPLRRGNIKLNDVVPSGQVAMLVSSSAPVVVERPLYEGPANLDQSIAAGVVFGRNGGGRTWLFPGGSQSGGNRDTYYFYNPGLRQNTLVATFYTSTGQTIQQTISLPPNGTARLDGASISGLANSATYGVRFTSTNNQLFVVEQRTQNSRAGELDGTQGSAQ